MIRMANTIIEFTDVLLCNHLYSYRLPEPYAYIHGGRGYKLPWNCRCAGTR